VRHRPQLDEVARTRRDVERHRRIGINALVEPAPIGADTLHEQPESPGQGDCEWELVDTFTDMVALQRKQLRALDEDGELVGPQRHGV
jgi:hypothetical protein